LARPAHGKISRNFGEIPQDDNKIGIIFAKSGKIARDFLIFQSIPRNFRSALSRPSTKLAVAVSGAAPICDRQAMFFELRTSITRGSQLLRKPKRNFFDGRR
jgi:hypothetical protein